jgi:hypothetical protein
MAEFLVIGVAFSMAFFVARLSLLAALLVRGATVEEAGGREVVIRVAGIEVLSFLEVGVGVFWLGNAEALRFSVEGVDTGVDAENCCAREPLAYLPAFGLVGMAKL